jgi:hypothetical protein
MGHSRPNEAIDFESALTSTPDISLHRTKRREGPSPDSCTATNVVESFAFESFKGTQIHATRTLVEQPSTASEVDMPAIGFWVNSGL